jgi:hypothetical protein
MKAIVLGFRDADPGPSAAEVVLRADVVFCGSDVPGGARSDSGPEGNGVPIPLNIGTITAASYSNAVETALVARAAALGLPVLANTDVLLPTYTRGT